MGVMNSAALILVIKEGDAGEREVTLPLGEFLKAPAAIHGPERQVQLGNDLRGLSHRRQRPREEFTSAYRPRSGRADEGDLGLAGYRNPGQFGGPVGMGKAGGEG